MKCCIKIIINILSEKRSYQIKAPFIHMYMYKNPPLTIICKKMEQKSIIMQICISSCQHSDPIQRNEKKNILVIMATSILDSHNLYIPAK